MLISDLDKLAALIRRERDGLLSRGREQVRALPSAQHLDVPTLNDHVPQFIDELAVKTFAAERALQVRSRRVLELAVPARSVGAAHAQMFKTLRRNVQHLAGLVGKVIEENTGLLSSSASSWSGARSICGRSLRPWVHFTLPPRQSAAAVEIS